MDKLKARAGKNLHNYPWEVWLFLSLSTVLLREPSMAGHRGKHLGFETIGLKI